VVAVVGLSVFLCLNTFGYLRDLHLRTESGSMNYDKVTAGREILDSASREGVFPDSRLRPDTYDTLQPLGPARIGVDALAVANGHLTVTGWAADSGGRLLARAVVLTVDGYPYRVMNYGFERQDIEHSTGLPLMKFSGFEDSVDLSKLAPGTHGYEFEVVAFDGRSAGAGPRGQFSIP
jgi:hypothetical protein